MSYYSNSLIKCRNVTQKIMDIFRKNGFIKGKMPIQCKNCLKLLGKIISISVNKKTKIGLLMFNHFRHIT